MNFTVGKKIWYGFLSILMIMLLLGATSLWALFKLNSEYKFLIDDRMQKVVLLEQLLSNGNEVENSIHSYLLFQKDEFLEGRSELNDTTQAIIQKLDALLVSQSAKDLLEDATLRIETYNGIMDIVIQSLQTDKDNFDKGMAYESSIQMEMAKERIDELKEQQLKQLHKTERDLENITLLIRSTTIGMIVLAVLLSIVIARRISKSIANPVARMTDSLKEIALGNFGIAPIHVKNKDEIGEMTSAFNKMVTDVKKIITSTRNSAVRLSQQAEELSASSEQSLASSEIVAEVANKNLQASATQVSVVQSSNESIDEMVTGINQIQEENENMLISTRTVSDLVTEGAGLMSAFTEQMKMICLKIEESTNTIREMATQSEQIRSVTAMISAIAEQTNLLALNAAIEAARAGEQGKGFAVVAEEVRNLAEQSKKSAGEIGELIDRMLSNVTNAVSSTSEGNDRINEGMAVTEETKAIFNQIQSAADDVGEKVSKASNTIEQIKAITEVVLKASTEVQSLAIQTSAEAQSTTSAMEEQLAVNEEISSCAQTLSELAEQLQNNLTRYTVN